MSVDKKSARGAASSASRRTFVVGAVAQLKLTFMDSLKKALEGITRMAEEGLIVSGSERIEIKRTRSGHYRLYVACGAGQKPEPVAQVKEVLADLDVTVNPFEKAGRLVSLQIVDNNEDQ